ncbi:phage antirepressor [Leucobacter ruminantium]|uniref:Phage antirepressor n=1 Tax=Leucobacter ruminantium TaxID=1289170 RepID=A0A939M0Q2_9MICO|nr:phage antirepressor [Leucobacter ruminantium]MBO1805877.1 phage antirepressor [Leucobacter ruminantium]
MSNQIVPFAFDGRDVRVVLIDNEPWFVLADLCRVLEIRNVGNAAARLDHEMKGIHQADTPGGRQSMTIVSEAGMYEVVIRSDKPEAAAFRRWITSEVLPQIRKTGSYGTQVALSEDEIVHQALAITARRVEQLEAKITADAPKVHFAEAVAASPSTILVGDLAKILRANGAPFGANRLFEKLRTDGYLIRRRGSDWNMPTQKSMELGLFEIKESTRQHPDGHVLLTKTPKVTGKGQQYFIEKYAPLDQLDLGGTAA